MLKEKKVRVLILAAGKGKRMKSELPKALAEVNGKPMIKHLLESVRKSGVDRKPIIVVGYKKEKVIQELGNRYEYVVQKKQLGTGHAVLAAKGKLKSVDYVMILYGDQPFISSKILKNVFKKSLTSSAKITFATTKVPNFKNEYKVFFTFARILRKNGKIISIREFKDSAEKEKDIKEVNAGCYVFDVKWLWKNLEKIDNKNSQKEYHLPDLICIATKNKEKVESIQIAPHEASGANYKEELAILEKLHRGATAKRK